MIFTYLKRIKLDFHSFELILLKSKYLHIDQSCYVCCGKRDVHEYRLNWLDPCTGSDQETTVLGCTFIRKLPAGEELVNFLIWQLIDWECRKPSHFNNSLKFLKPSKTPVHFKFQGHLQAARARASSTVHRQTT